MFKKKKLLLILILVIYFGMINTIILNQVPVFADGAWHLSIIREINCEGYYPDSSPTGWVTPELTPVSIESPINHPMVFYILSATLSLLINDIEIAVNIIEILSIIFLLIIFYLMVSKSLDEKVGLYTLFFLSFTPMFLWVVSHRTIEPLLYFMVILSLYGYIRYSKTHNFSDLLLLVLFITCLFLIKASSWPFIIIVSLLILFKEKRLNDLIILLVLIIILSAPYIHYSINTRGTISPVQPGLPLLDKYVFNPWWSQERSLWDQQLAIESNENHLFEIRGSSHPNLKYTLLNNIQQGNLFGILQKFSIFPVSNMSGNHWYSPIGGGNIRYLFTLILTLGILFYIITNKYRQSIFTAVFCATLIIGSIFYLHIGIDRHLFYVQIIFSLLYGVGIVSILHVFLKKRWAVSIIIMVLVVSLILVNVSEIKDIESYKISLHHNVLSEGGIIELAALQNELNLNIPSDRNIFTPVHSEVSYYLNCPTIWDYRIFFINKNEVLYYFPYYNVTYLIIPNTMIKDQIYHNGYMKEVQNTKENWTGNSIPVDSGFYKLLEEGTHFKIIKQYKAFTVYEFISDINE